MRICRNMSPVLRDEFANSQRRFGRIKCADTGCSLGEVMDLSAGGMRIRCRGPMGLRLGDTTGITLRSGSGSLIPLPSKVVWMHKTGWRCWELGLVFVDLSPGARESLNSVARDVTFLGDTSVA